MFTGSYNYTAVLYLHNIESSVDVFIDEKKVFTGLFFQDAIMKYNFNCFPEVILLMLHTNSMNYACHYT